MTTAVESLTRELVLGDDKLHRVMANLMKEFKNGLSKKGNPTASVKMFPTYVRDVPHGREEGKFMALDLGGTNFRVLIIDLKGDEFKMENEIYPISQETMLGTGEQLFDHIAECLANFMDKKGVKHMKLPLGFTFSFPCSQEGLTAARLVQWTKGFRCSGVEGQDVVELLRAALKRRNDVDIDVTAVVNDTTGTLMSCAHRNRKCRVGVIVGTGTNACYMEKLDKVETWNEEYDEPNQVIVNTEWGAFGDTGELEFVRTKWDRLVDEESLNVGKQKFEKMISGMYMGEIVRQVLLDLTRQGLMFGGETSKKLLTKNRFKTAYVSYVESDQKGDWTQMRKVLEKMDLLDIATETDYKNMRLICARVSTRAAYLVSAAISTMLNKMARKHTTVGVDGSVYRYHPHFHNLMVGKIAELINPRYEFDLMLSEDGSGRGAALVAAVATSLVRAKLWRQQSQMSMYSTGSFDTDYSPYSTTNSLPGGPKSATSPRPHAVSAFGALNNNHPTTTSNPTLSSSAYNYDLSPVPENGQPRDYYMTINNPPTSATIFENDAKNYQLVRQHSESENGPISRENGPSTTATGPKGDSSTSSSATACLSALLKSAGSSLPTPSRDSLSTTSVPVMLAAATLVCLAGFALVRLTRTNR